MKNSHYQSAKQQLKDIADQVKKSHPNDKPGQREAINNMEDSLSRDFWRYTSEKQAKQWREWLALYACKLHPKDKR